MVGFCDLVGTGIAPVSKKNAVKDFLLLLCEENVCTAERDFRDLLSPVTIGSTGF